jgi:hypothetical protein
MGNLHGKGGALITKGTWVTLGLGNDHDHGEVLTVSEHTLRIRWKIAKDIYFEDVSIAPSLSVYDKEPSADECPDCPSKKP